MNDQTSTQNKRRKLIEFHIFVGGGMAQAVECLLYKHKALSSNSSPTKKKTKTKKKPTLHIFVGKGSFYDFAIRIKYK
jgi:hypothetical protein